MRRKLLREVLSRAARGGAKMKAKKEVEEITEKRDGKVSDGRKQLEWKNSKKKFFFQSLVEASRPTTKGGGLGGPPRAPRLLCSVSTLLVNKKGESRKKFSQRGNGKVFL